MAVSRPSRRCAVLCGDILDTDSIPGEIVDSCSVESVMNDDDDATVMELMPVCPTRCIDQQHIPVENSASRLLHSDFILMRD